MTTRSKPGRSLARPRPLRTSVLSGVVLALLTLAAGGAYALTQQVTYTAESVLLVLPRADLDDATSAAFYETMSRGQIVGTFAEVANNPSFQAQALDQLGLTPQERQDLTTEVTVVPDTSVILVRVTSPSATAAAQASVATARTTTTYLATLTTAFRTQLVQGATGATPSSGLTPALVLALTGVVAVVLGVAAQQAVYHLLAARRLALRPEEPARAVVPVSAPGADPGRAAVRAEDELRLAGRA